MLTFENPEALLLLILIPIVFYFNRLWSKRGGKLVFTYSNFKGLRFLPPITIQTVLYVLAQIAFWLGLIFLVIGISGPTEVVRERVFLNRGIDIMVVMDVSRTMAAQDVLAPGLDTPPISRLEQAKKTITEFIEQRSNDSVGLVAFGTQALLKVPPTLDYDFIIERINGLQILELGDGSAIGMGIALAALHIRNSTAQEKIIILLSDGVNNSGEILPQTAASLSKEAGIRIYTIGIGSNADAPFEYVDPESGKRSYGVISGSINQELLEELAQTTGGNAYFVSNPSGLDAALQNIDATERIENRPRIEVRKEPIYKNFIILSIILICFDLVIRKLILREVL